MTTACPGISSPDLRGFDIEKWSGALVARKQEPRLHRQRTKRGTYAPGIAHGESLAGTGRRQTQHIASVPTRRRTRVAARHIDVALYVFSDVGIGKALGKIVETALLSRSSLWQQLFQ